MPDQITRRTQQERRSEAERKLLDAAARLIAERGSSATTLAQVGEAAGYSRGLVHHHFGSKAALLDRLAKSVQAAFDEAVAPAVAGRHGLDVLLGRVDSWAASFEHLASPERGFLGRAFLVMWAEAAIGIPEMRAAMARSDWRFRHTVADAVLKGQADGSIRDDADADAVAAMVVGMLRGIGLQLLIDAPALDFRVLREQVPASLLEALRTRPGSNQGDPAWTEGHPDGEGVP